MPNIQNINELGRRFADRHCGPDGEQIKQMLDQVGVKDEAELLRKTVPENILTDAALDLGPAESEKEALTRLRRIAVQNKVLRSYIGMGYYNTLTPPVIQRNILENPGWYTQYTPYQAEIAQGRLESLLNFQTMVMDLTGMDVANASVLDEGTSAAEAMSICDMAKNRKQDRVFFVADDCFPQTIELVRTRAKARGIAIEVGAADGFKADQKYFGALFQYPNVDGLVRDYEPLIKALHENDALVVMAADILALAKLRSPGSLGADIAVGSTQRFGVPLGFGGPHAGYLAAKEEHLRRLPGRIVGVSKDARGKPVVRLSLQTREQHIRREKATSNICTAQVLLANMAAMYAVYHGPEGIAAIAERVHGLTAALAKGVTKLGHIVENPFFFDTLTINLEKRTAKEVHQFAETRGINFRRIDEGRVGVSVDETTTAEDLTDILECLNFGELSFDVYELEFEPLQSIPPKLVRQEKFLQDPVFNKYHSETELMRYIRRLESKDLSLTQSMIPLGSCTMKLNAAAELMPITWPEFNSIHPFAPQEQWQGYSQLFNELEAMLCTVTGFDAFSLQPNSGAQGEYAGLLAIQKYHEARGNEQRTVCLIPSSAHGTNPASAVMAGMKVVVVKCDNDGNIDLDDLAQKIEKHAEQLSALMVTYPSTHGVFEETIVAICEMIHKAGGQVYMDGANMNAQIGVCLPGKFGPDVCHLNLHKTFCIPHGGGGPGVGPIGVKAHLREFLPDNPVVDMKIGKSMGPVAAAPWGSASILPISWMYIRMMGAKGLRRATEVAILNANYAAKRLSESYPVLYTGKNGFVAHECIIDLRQIQKKTGVTVEDVAKRLMDFGFHAPTIAWPVPGTMMIEPTESESKDEIDRFCDAMIMIREEIAQIESGAADKKNNLLKNAPHTARMIAEEWDFPYTREEAAFKAPWSKEHKFWPSVARIDNAFGDRNFVCSCPGLDAYES